MHVRVCGSCQTYEGGFGGEPWNEAHGGYAFCAVAALAILDSLHLADVDALKVVVLYCMVLSSVRKCVFVAVCSTG